MSDKDKKKKKDKQTPDPKSVPLGAGLAARAARLLGGRGRDIDSAVEHATRSGGPRQGGPGRDNDDD